MLSPAPFSLHAKPSEPWNLVATLHRRICVLRAIGRTADAERIEAGEFASARAAAETHLSEPPAADTALFLPALLAAEETRVAEALVLAELLAPLLAERLKTVETDRSAVSPLHSLSPQSRRPASAAARSSAALSIADLIDGMLDQQPPPDRGR